MNRGRRWKGGNVWRNEWRNGRRAVRRKNILERMDGGIDGFREKMIYKRDGRMDRDE